MSINKALSDPLFKFPVRNVSPINMESPNAPITIHDGGFKLCKEGNTLVMLGKVTFCWQPNLGVKFEGEILAGYLSNTQPDFSSYILEIDDFKFGEASILEMATSFQNGKSTIKGKVPNATWKNGLVPVNVIRFGVANFRDWMGACVTDDGSEFENFERARITLEDSDYIINLDKVKHYSDRLKQIEISGGYMLLYAGAIHKKKGTINLEQLKNWMPCLCQFLNFLNGRRVSPLFYSGLQKDDILWTDYIGYPNDPYTNSIISWSENIDPRYINASWIKFNKLWSDPNSKSFLESLIHWYIESNNQSGFVEGSIIMAQIALELLFNWFVVEERKIIRDDPNLSASNKIRLLISQFGLSCDIPMDFKKLSPWSKKTGFDGPEALVHIRNIFVHSKEKNRKKVKEIDSEVIHEAHQLALWYIEIATLNILDYSGFYHNRTILDNNVNSVVSLPRIIQ